MQIENVLSKTHASLHNDDCKAVLIGTINVNDVEI